MLPFSRMKHIGFEVDDIEKAEALHTRVLGFPSGGINTISLEGGKGIVKNTFFHLEKGSIELTDHHLLPESWKDSPLRTGPGFHHLAFEVVDFDEVLSNLAKQGILPLSQFPFKTPHGRVAFFPRKRPEGFSWNSVKEQNPEGGSHGQERREGKGKGAHRRRDRCHDGSDEEDYPGWGRPD